jgi:DNA-binding transcriptional regulator LsrR (DeoR family)
VTMSASRDRTVLVKAARMYFLDGRSQDDIARVIGTTRSNVSRMLAAARAQGVVEIRVHEQVARAEGLEQALRQRFGLAHVRVASFQPGVDAQKAAGDLAARWLDEALCDGSVLGLSWGTALQAMVSAVSVGRPRSVEVVPLVGGLKTAESLVAAQELVRELAGRLGATYRYLHAPALLRSNVVRQALLTEPVISEVLARARAADIAMVGVGTVGTGSSNEIVDGLGLTGTERRAFLAAGPVGDTCCRFFDAAGRPIRGVSHDRVIAVECEELANIPTVIGVATGVEKAPGVRAAVRGGIISGLITDSSLALALLSGSSHVGEGG